MRWGRQCGGFKKDILGEKEKKRERERERGRERRERVREREGLRSVKQMGNFSL